MPTINPQVDLYIFKSAEFAKPILNHLRGLVHKACPEVEEKIKWGMPHFNYKGMMCSMAAFKQHCAFTFYKAPLMKDKKLMANAKSETAMGHLGRISSLKDLPSDKVLLAYIKEAKKLNDDGVKLPAKSAAAKKKEIVVPDYFSKELKRNKTALKTFEKFPPSHKREYIEWIIEAKTENTRNRRIAATIEWLSEGKSRNWRYEKK
ncbi:MAG: YdeI/OmpD-associated family protein [Ignavibacteriaceae bacterium]|nr:YdeI/OmpD-associated family protein [Ignavibacteriaceae bacterium]